MLVDLCLVLLKEGWDRESKPRDEDEADMIPEETDTLTLQIASARPRRLAELNIATKVKPIPSYSSMFIFSPSNRFAAFITQIHLYHFHVFLSSTYDMFKTCFYSPCVVYNLHQRLLCVRKCFLFTYLLNSLYNFLKR